MARRQSDDDADELFMAQMQNLLAVMRQSSPKQRKTVMGILLVVITWLRYVYMYLYMIEGRGNTE